MPRHDKPGATAKPLVKDGSHAFANMLLELPDAPLVLVKAAGGPYHQDFHVHGYPWHADALGQIRVMVSDSNAAEAGPPISGPREL